MNLKILLVLLPLLLLACNTSAFTPAPCVTATECDCEIEFCTYWQADDYIRSEKVKDLIGGAISSTGLTTSSELYLYGSFPSSWGKKVFKSNYSAHGFGYKGTEIHDYKVEDVSGFHQYKVLFNREWGWNKATLGGYTFPVPTNAKGIILTFSVNDPGVNHIGGIKASAALEKKFKDACDGWRGKVEPWPCIGLFEVGELTIRRKIFGTISPPSEVASIYIKGLSGTSTYASINAGNFEISPVEAGVTYKLAAIAKQGSAYLDWAEDVIVAIDKDLQKNITLQKNPTTAQGTGTGSLKIELVSEKGEGIAGTAAYNILTNPNKVETMDVPAEGATKTGLPAGNYKITITPKDGKYVPNPHTTYQFPVNSNVSNVLRVTFSESSAPVQPQQPSQQQPGTQVGVKGAVGFKFSNLQQLYDKAKADKHSYSFDTVVSSLKVKEKLGGVASVAITKVNATDTVKVDSLMAGKAYTLYIELPDYNPMNITDFTPTEEQFKQ